MFAAASKQTPGWDGGSAAQPAGPGLWLVPNQRLVYEGGMKPSECQFLTSVVESGQEDLFFFKCYTESNCTQIFVRK